LFSSRSNSHDIPLWQAFKKHKLSWSRFSRRSLGEKGRVVGFLFGIPFFAAGLLFFWIGALKPILKVVSSGEWPQVACVISESEVERHSGSDGTTYSVEIRFRYEYDGVSYEGGSYNFRKSSSMDVKRRPIDEAPIP
jgi:hypothetical protein